MNSKAQIEFGRAKEERLPDICRSCDYRFACHYECTTNRFL